MELEALNLFAYRNTKLIWKNVNIKIKNGELVCLVGPNGIGKTTLLTVLAGLKNTGIRTVGDIFLDKQPLSSFTRKECAKSIAILLQNENFIWNYEVQDIVLAGRYAYANAYYTKEDYAIVKKIMADVGIQNFAQRKIHSLSGGELQKVRIARSLAQGASILLLDEVFANLDFGYQNDLVNLLLNLAHNENKAILLSIHDVNMAARFADKIALLGEDGLIIGKAKEVIVPEVLQKVYNTPLYAFEHPVYHCPQVCT